MIIIVFFLINLTKMQSITKIIKKNFLFFFLTISDADLRAQQAQNEQQKEESECAMEGGNNTNNSSVDNTKTE